ncbi:hypothetical protein HOY80DRAFT_1074068 [Tuber brumale]|nr:hypothetical protein HOY80DRAFT_1074068 [Tuber brumale]
MDPAGLYRELWEEGSKFVYDVELQIPQPPDGFEPVTHTLPSGGTQFLIRKDYDDLIHLLSAAELERWDTQTGRRKWPCRLDYKVSGQPGTGRSVFLNYLLLHRLHQNLPTVLRYSNRRYYLFDESTPGSQVAAETLFQLSPEKKRSLWILTDEAIIDARWTNRNHSWFIVLGSSPALVRQSRQWENDRNVGVHYMRNWVWSEIFAAFSLRGSAPPTDTLGPVARTCLLLVPPWSNQAYKLGLSKHVGDLEREILAFIARGGYQSIHNTVDKRSSDKMILMDPTVTGRSYTARIATRWIAHKVFVKALQESQQDCFQLFERMSNQPNLRIAAGWFFEAYAHAWFRQGGTFCMDKLPIADNESPTFEFSTEQSESPLLHYFTTADDLCSQVCGPGSSRILPSAIAQYFLPYCCNYESLDGLVFSSMETLVLLQITMARSHEIKEDGMRGLLRSLPASIHNVQVVFVISEDRIRDYTKCQKIPDASSLNLGPRSFKISQFRLVLRKVDIQSVSACGGRNDNGGEEDQESDTEMTDLF